MSRCRLLALALPLVLLVPYRAAGSGGDLDPTFGDAGVFTVRTTPSGGYHPVRRAPENKVVGMLGDSPSTLYRAFDDGTIDPSFGTDGFLDLPSGMSYHDLAVAPDGAILLCGDASPPPQYDAFVARYLPTGVPDPAFGTNGVVRTNFSGGFDTAYSLVLMDDGRIVTGGRAGSDSAMARYHSDGTLDATFGSGGIVVLDLGGPPSGLDTVFPFAVLADGRILAGLQGSGPPGTPVGLHTVRFNANGSLDTTFGGAGTGIATVPIGDSPAPGAGALLPDGKLLVSGESTNNIPDRDFELGRLLDDGTLDSAFGAGTGYVTTDLGGDDESSMLLPLPDGGILLGGRHQPTGGELHIAFVRYESDGTRDLTFGTGGLAVYPVDDFSQPSGGAFLIANGDVIVGGSSFPNDVRNFLLRFATCGPCDVRNGSGVCVTAPPAGCVRPAMPLHAQLALRDSPDDRKDKLQLTLRTLTANVADFGDVGGGDRLALCLFSGSPTAPTALARTGIAGGDQCGGVPCWRALGSGGAKGWRRKDTDGTSDGITMTALKPGPGSGVIRVKGKGLHLQLPPLPFFSPVSARVQAASGACWEAEFTGSNATVNSTSGFRGSGD